MKDRPGGVDRRGVLVGSLALAVASPALAAPARSDLVFIGMHGPQIRAARFDAKTGALTMLGAVADNRRPTWAIRHPSRPVLYFNEDAGADSRVQALNVDAKTGALTKISDVHTAAGPTYMFFDRPSATLLVAHYDAGAVSALLVARDGALGAPVANVAFKGSGPHPRQTSPHAHCCLVDPSGKYVLVADMGSDRVWVLPFDRRTRTFGAYDPAAAAHYVLPPGSGPRHLAFHADGKTIYLIAELTAEIHVLSWDARAGRLQSKQRFALNEPGFSGRVSGAEIALSRDGRFAYAANRSDHTMVALSIDPSSKMLTRIQKIPAGGDNPWHFAIHPSGDWLITAPRDANTLAVFRVDKKTGLLADANVRLETPSPVCVQFWP